MGKATHFQSNDGKTYCGIRGSHHFTWVWGSVDCKRCLAKRKNKKGGGD